MYRKGFQHYESQRYTFLGDFWAALYYRPCLIGVYFNKRKSVIWPLDFMQYILYTLDFRSHFPYISRKIWKTCFQNCYRVKFIIFHWIVLNLRVVPLGIICRFYGHNIMISPKKLLSLSAVFARSEYLW